MITTRNQKFCMLRRSSSAALKLVSKKPNRRGCGLCGRKFATRSKFDRFCAVCKEQSELYHFFETLPGC